MTEIEGKVKYVKLARSLQTYGVSFFLVKVSRSLPLKKICKKLFLLMQKLFLPTMPTKNRQMPTKIKRCHHFSFFE